MLSKLKDLCEIGSIMWFEYHCFESHQSSDALAWYHSHQQVTVLSGPYWDDKSINTITDEEAEHISPTLIGRSEDCCILIYKVRFSDGLEYDVFEDELLNSKEGFDRPDPPQPQVYGLSTEQG